MADIPLSIESPLLNCLWHCQVSCVAACCGLDSFPQDPTDNVAEWGRQAGPEAALHALCQLESLITAVADPANTVVLDLLGYDYRASDEAERQELLAFLALYRAALESLV